MNDLHLLADDWLPVDQVSAGTLSEELSAEMGQDHVLRHERWQVIARRLSRDDIIVLLDDGRVAKVHLTWNLHPEPDGYWPSTEIHASMAALASSLEK